MHKEEHILKAAEIIFTHFPAITLKNEKFNHYLKITHVTFRKQEIDENFPK